MTSPGLLYLLRLSLLFYFAMGRGQTCIRKYTAGKWISAGNCPTRGELKSVLEQIKLTAEKGENTDKVTSEADKCQGKKLKNISVTLDGTTSNRYASLSGGWTVIQRREDGSVNFERKWVEYVNGFGDPCGEYWLGLEAIYQLTRNGNQKLRIDMIENGTDTHHYVEYSEFKISSGREKYMLTVSGHSGDLADALADTKNYYHDSNGKKFSTIDQENYSTKGSQDCVSESGGGWWQAGCSHVRLNGRYNGKNYKGIAWNTNGEILNLKFVEMKIKKKN